MALPIFELVRPGRDVTGVTIAEAQLLDDGDLYGYFDGDDRAAVEFVGLTYRPDPPQEWVAVMYRHETGELCHFSKKAIRKIAATLLDDRMKPSQCLRALAAFNEHPQGRDRVPPPDFPSELVH